MRTMVIAGVIVILVILIAVVGFPGLDSEEIPQESANPHAIDH